MYLSIIWMSWEILWDASWCNPTYIQVFILHPTYLFLEIFISWYLWNGIRKVEGTDSWQDTHKDDGGCRRNESCPLICRRYVQHGWPCQTVDSNLQGSQIPNLTNMLLHHPWNTVANRCLKVSKWGCERSTFSEGRVGVLDRNLSLLGQELRQLSRFILNHSPKFADFTGLLDWEMNLCFVEKEKFSLVVCRRDGWSMILIDSSIDLGRNTLS